MKYIQKPYWFFKKNRSILYSESPRFIEVMITQRMAYPVKLIPGLFMVLNPHYTLLGGSYISASPIHVEGNDIVTLERQEIEYPLLLFGSTIISKGDDYNAFIKKDYSSRFIEVLIIFPSDIFGVVYSEELFLVNDLKVGDKITLRNGFYTRALNNELKIGEVISIIKEDNSEIQYLETTNGFNQQTYIYILFSPSRA
ncbi:MAG: hypothetical protein QXI58_00325 [Candidatus Micrarchaeia archaeon]